MHVCSVFNVLCFLWAVCWAVIVSTLLGAPLYVVLNVNTSWKADQHIFILQHKVVLSNLAKLKIEAISEKS